MEELRAANQEVERGLRGIMLGLDYDEFGFRRKVGPSTGYDVFLSWRDEKDDGRVFHVIGGKDETAVTVISVVVNSGLCQTAFDQLAFKVVRDRTSPATMEDDIAMYTSEVLRSKWCAVIEAESEGLFR